MTVSVIAEALDDFERYLTRAPEIARKAASRAINSTLSRKALPAARKQIGLQVGFPAGYLQDPARLGLAQWASESNLQGAILGRQRPTSLARFAIGGQVGAKGGVTVRVKPGQSQHMDRAFLMRLKAGSGPITDDAFNLGLAVRLRPNERIENKRVQVKAIGGGLYLLYGPSVDQVFRTVAGEMAPQIADDATREFLRQFLVLSEG